MTKAVNLVISLHEFADIQDGLLHKIREFNAKQNHSFQQEAIEKYQTRVRELKALRVKLSQQAYGA